MMSMVKGDPYMWTSSQVILSYPSLVVLIGVRKISYLLKTSLYRDSPKRRNVTQANLTCDFIEAIEKLCFKLETGYPIDNVPINVSRDDDKEVPYCGLEGHVGDELLSVIIDEFWDLKGFNY
jgi:hypothetical protein